MKNLLKKCDLALLKAKVAAKKFLSEERGDTNFISIAIILVVVIVIAIVFIQLGDSLSNALGNRVNELKNALKI